MPPLPTHPRSILGLVFLVHFGAWLILRQIGLPISFTDDLFYNGAAVNLAQAGRLFNPWLADQYPNLNTYYAYAPLTVALIAAWFKLFGVGASGLTLLWAFSGAVGSTSLAVIARNLTGLSTANPLAFVLLVGPLGYYGFRPEILGFPLALLGVCLVFGSSWLAVFTGSLAIGSAILAAPQTLGPLLIAGFVFLLSVRREPRRLAMTVGLLILAAVILAGWMVYLVQGQYTELLTGILSNRDRWNLLAVEPLGLGGFWYSAFVVTAGIALLYVWRRRWPDRAALILMLAVFTFPAIRLLHVRPELLALFRPTVVLLAVFSCTTFLPIRLGPFSRWGLRAFAIGAVMLVLVVAHGIVASRAPFFHPSPAERGRVAAEIAERRSAGGRLLVDSGTARTIWDFRTPPGTIDFSFSKPFPDAFPPNLPSAMRPGEVWAIGEETVIELLLFRLKRMPSGAEAEVTAGYGFGQSSGSFRRFEDQAARVILWFAGFPRGEAKLPRRPRPVCVVTEVDMASAETPAQAGDALWTACHRGRTT